MISNTELMGFEDWLRTNTTLLPSSITQYRKTISMFFSRHDEATIENMNKFIMETESRRCYISKYAFRQYLMFKGRVNDVGLLRKSRKMPRKKQYVILTNEELENAISKIEDEQHRIVALIQYVTGARASEALSIKKENVMIEDDGIMIDLWGKGAKEGSVFMPFPYSKPVLDYINRREEQYPFLKGRVKDLNRRISNSYVYYLQSIKGVMKELGYGSFATHDLRANFGTHFYDLTGDIKATQQAMRHIRMETTAGYIQRRGINNIKQSIKMMFPSSEISEQGK